MSNNNSWYKFITYIKLANWGKTPNGNTLLPSITMMIRSACPIIDLVFLITLSACVYSVTEMLTLHWFDIFYLWSSKAVRWNHILILSWGNFLFKKKQRNDVSSLEIKIGFFFIIIISSISLHFHKEIKLSA